MPTTLGATFRRTDEDIEHAVRNAIRAVGQGDRDPYIGADQTGRLLEAVVLDDDDPAERP